MRGFRGASPQLLTATSAVSGPWAQRAHEEARVRSKGQPSVPGRWPHLVTISLSQWGERDTGPSGWLPRRGPDKQLPRERLSAVLLGGSRSPHSAWTLSRFPFGPALPSTVAQAAGNFLISKSNPMHHESEPKLLQQVEADGSGRRPWGWGGSSPPGPLPRSLSVTPEKRQEHTSQSRAVVTRVSRQGCPWPRVVCEYKEPRCRLPAQPGCSQFRRKQRQLFCSVALCLLKTHLMNSSLSNLSLNAGERGKNPASGRKA